MQSTQTKQFITPQRVVWQYQTRESGRIWIDADSATLLFHLIPSGQVTSYRVKPKCESSARACDGESRCILHR